MAQSSLGGHGDVVLVEADLGHVMVAVGHVLVAWLCLVRPLFGRIFTNFDSIPGRRVFS